MAFLASVGSIMGKVNVTKQFLTYLKKYKGVIGGLAILSTLSAIATIPIPYVYAVLIDEILPSKNQVSLMLGVGVLIGLMAINAILSFLLILVGASVRTKFRSQLRSRIFAKLQRLPYERISTFISGDLVSRITRDLDELKVLLPLGIAQLLKDGLSITGIIGVMVWMNWKLTLISGVMMPLFFLLFLIMMRSLESIAKKNHETKGKLQASLLEKVEGNRDIQLTNSFDHQHQSASKEIYESEQVLTRFNIQEAKMGLVFALFPIIGSSILWGLGGYWTIINLISIGEIIAFSYAFNYLFQPISSVFSAMSEMPNEMTALERIFELFSDEKSNNTPLTKLRTRINGDIKCCDVSFGYKNKPLLIENLSLSIQPGTLTAIIGQNGVGKSTFFSLLLNLYKLDRGEIRIGGHLLANIHNDDLRRSIGFVPQQAFLFKGSIKENIMMGRQISQKDFQSACELSGVNECLTKYNKGLGTMIREKGSNLSGGEKQKIAIARALVEKPSILLLDEPTNNLDESLKASIQQSLLLAKAGMTIVLITHDSSMLGGIRNIYEFKDKKLIKKEVQYG